MAVPSSASAAPVIAADKAHAMNRELLTAVYRGAVPGTVGSLLTAPALALILLYLHSTDAWAAGLFVTAVVASSVARLALVYRYRHATPATRAAPRWFYLMAASVFAGGLSWGGGAIFLLQAARLDVQFLVLLVVLSMAAGAMAAFGARLELYCLNFVPMLAPPMLWMLGQGNLLHYALALFMSLWIAAIMSLARQYNATILESLRLRFENLDLVADLRRQKDAAEDANIAKSRFLASASHDLRQPVHALGMFVGALRARPMDEDARRLVEHIDHSIAAMDGLFTSLLDISRLDAGVIHTHRQPCPIAPMLARICGDHAEEAAAKGIRLSHVSCSRCVDTDPTLLERILRNLVCNAVRYTDKGRVLVCCRRRGDWLSVEVRDTGRGIPAHEQEKVFQEFYQLGNPERDRSKGLGLGLAIVKRLTGLLEIPLMLRSSPGKGTMFAVSVRIAATPDSGESEPEATSAYGVGAHGTILVVDDELAIRAAMQSLLTSWGYQVISAGSTAEMIDRAVTLPSPPDLIISDYRLRDAEDGISAIRRLQSEFNEDIPGMLITGDTAPDRLKEAQESGFLLLHKPVSNSKLRAAIVNLTRTWPIET
jgi:signal transduction histidine kinase/CheY-like chemotaxis protein